MYDKIIRQSTYDCFKLKFIFLYLMNVTDILFTLFLLKTGLFIEGNYFMNIMLNNKYFTLWFKILIPALLLIYLYARMSYASEAQLRFANVLIIICIAFYFLLNVSHIVWTLLFLFYTFA